MATLYLKLEKQLLTKLNEEIIAAGDSNVDSCAFEFDSYWDGYTRTAVFYQNKEDVHYALLDSSDTCMIPAAAMLQRGKMYMGVFGIQGAQILTSTVAHIQIEEGAVTGIDIDIQPSDDIFLAIVAQYQALAEQMQIHNQSADDIKAEFDRQNEILDSLNAFEVVELENDVRALKANTADLLQRTETLEGTVLVLNNVEVDFNSNIFKIEDERVTADSLVDVYFSTDSFEEATDAGITVESEKGYINIKCAYVPSFPLYASIVVRVVIL